MEITFLGIACLIAFALGRGDKWLVQRQLDQLRSVFDGAVKEVRRDGALLPSLVRWADSIDRARDEAIALTLRTKDRPAHKAAEEVQAARAEKREAQRELRVALNRVDLYESLAPWLNEYTELSVGELIEALRAEQRAQESAESGEDPVALYVPTSEWQKMSLEKRNQLALDRYSDPRRRRTPWEAGIQYERFVGYVYENLGYSVAYHGALRGKEDQGIDLICENADAIRVVQCKRLSKEKAIPIRENVVAQIFGAAEFFRMENCTTKVVRPVLVTTYELSDEAKRFAKHLNVEVNEIFELQEYPMIKCNISQGSGEKIYHLPMDQQYDAVIIGDREGECYARTVAEAERKGFRRAFRWSGGG